MSGYEGMEWELNALEPNLDLLVVNDDVIPDWLANTASRQMQHIEWVYKEGSYPGGKKFFTKTFYDVALNLHDRECPNIIYDIADMMHEKVGEFLEPEAKVDNFLRVMANGQLPDTPADIHQDLIHGSQTAWSLIYYANDSDGGTKFYANDFKTVVKEVEFKKGRIVIFPSCWHHQGVAPSNSWRISLGYIFDIKTYLNAKVWKTNF